MRQFGDFLEAVHGPSDRFRTVRAVVRQWQDLGALVRAMSEGRRSGRRKPGAGPQTNTALRETVIRVWLDIMKRARVEETYHRNGTTASWLTVAGNGRWWQRDQYGHVEEGQSEIAGGRACPDLTDVERHFSTAVLREYFAQLTPTPLDNVQTAGRDCLRVRAVPQPDGGLWPHWLGFGADEYELHADVEYGAVLFVASKYRGDVLETNEVTEVTFDEPLADELFIYEPRPGEQVRPAVPVVEHLSLAAAVAQMTFTVLVPTPGPASNRSRVEVMFHPGRVNSPRQYLTLMYLSGTSLRIHQSGTPAPLDEYEWEPVERDGRRVEISDPGPGKGRRLVRLEHLGTHVDIWSDLDREQLLDVAASLVPAPKG